ncbi:MAG TPA: phage Gp37/Gp68 family protein [Acidiferrobacteraceae bacterium]|nr:phage Gp37/Gp68 family protein [Acidiferrobacteraceae bacterium]
MPSKIEWTDNTWNPVTGCTKVSQGCKHCYAEREWIRLSANPKTVQFGRCFTDVQCHPSRLDKPLHWRKPRRVFVNSMSDLFHVDVPTQFIDEVFAVMALCTQHTFQILTKRPERMLRYLAYTDPKARIDAVINENRFDKYCRRDGWVEGMDRFIGQWPLKNVALGISAEDQPTFNRRILPLMETPAAIRWISIEPMLGLIDLHFGFFLDDVLWRRRHHGHCLDKPMIDWVVVGGESGPKARPMHPDWARSVRDQCVSVEVPFHFKQWGEWAPRDVAMQIYGKDYDPNNDVEMARVGKKKSGRELDGRTWNECPA